MGRFELKMLAIMLLLAVIPLITSTLLVKMLVRDSINLGVNRNHLNVLKRAEEIYKKYKNTKRGQFILTKKLLSTSRTLQDAIDQDNDEAAAAEVMNFLKSQPEVYDVSISVNRSHEKEGKITDTEGPESDKQENQPNTYEPYIYIKNPKDFPEDEWRIVPPYKEEVILSGKVPFKIEMRPAFERSIDYFQQETDTITREYENIVESVLESERLFSEKYSASFILLYSIIIIITVFVAVLLTRTLTKRIGFLVEATQRVAKGDLSFHLESRFDDEIGDLINSFNVMVEELSENRRKIEYLTKIGAWQEIARRLAHEIKNPLTPILLAVQQIKNKYDGTDERFQKLLNDSVEIVTEEVGGLRRMVEEFSAFAKLPNARFETGEIHTFINEFLSKHAFFEGQINIDWQRGGKEAVLQFDRLLMERVLYNIIENAIHAAIHRDPSDRKLVIETQTDKEGGRFRISFSDNGMGIPDEDKPRIFDPYFTTKQEGTGLGLAIVKKIVLEHGGKLDVEDNPSGGARFIIELPIPR